MTPPDPKVDVPTLAFALSCGPSTNALHYQPSGFRHRIRTPEYSKWLLEAGWEAKAATVGVPQIRGTFDWHLVVPKKSRRDRNNWDKAVLDLLEYVGIIRNDKGQDRYWVSAEDRDDVLIRLWDRGGPEQQLPRKTYRLSMPRPKRPTAKQLRLGQRILP
jgi:Holliday junction resolvase RusA-like endonuclease